MGSLSVPLRGGSFLSGCQRRRGHRLDSVLFRDVNVPEWHGIQPAFRPPLFPFCLVTLTLYQRAVYTFGSAMAGGGGGGFALLGTSAWPLCRALYSGLPPPSCARKPFRTSADGAVELRVYR